MLKQEATMNFPQFFGVVFFSMLVIGFAFDRFMKGAQPDDDEEEEPSDDVPFDDQGCPFGTGHGW